MKNLRYPIPRNHYFLLLLVFFSCSCLQAQHFQRQFGTVSDNIFSKVFQDGSHFYVLGFDTPIFGSTPQATVTRLDANGMQIWTLSLDIPSVWNDGVLTPSGDLLLVGATLPADPSSKSLIGLVTSANGGQFSWVRTYDVPGREENRRIIKNPSPQNPSFPYYIVGAQFDPNGDPLWDDIFLLNIDAAGNVKWKRKFPSVEDDEFGRDLEALPSGDMILSGNLGSNGILLQVNNSGSIFSGASPTGVSFTYVDVTAASTGGFYAVGNTFPSITNYLMKYDQDMLPQWEVSFTSLTNIRSVWEEPATGEIYVTGDWNGGSTFRTIVLNIKEVAGAPLLQWVRYLENSEFGYYFGHTSFLPPDRLAFADGRWPTLNGFGFTDAFISISDLDMQTCMTQDDVLNINPVSFTYDAPNVADMEFFDYSIGTDVTSSAINWQQETVCNSPCQADFIITPLGGCGHYQVTNTSTGVQPLVYTWCNGSTQQDLDVMLPCGPHTFCLTITDANGCTSSYDETITVIDTIPPVARCALPLGVVLAPDCTYTIDPMQIDGGSADNCQIQSLSASPAILTGCGVFPVTLTVTDWCGNTNTCVTSIQAIEDVPPVIECPSSMQLSTASTSCNMVVNGLQWTSMSDNCSTPSVTYVINGASNYTGVGDASGLIFEQGLSTVTYIATDDCGNGASCSFDVQVTCICDCPNNLLLNSGFYEGAVAGNYLGQNASSDHWIAGGLSPQVVQEDSCCDAYAIQLWGNYYNGESINQQGLNIQAGHHYKISFCARFWPGNPNVNSISFGFNAASATTNPYNCQPCEQIGISTPITSATWGTYTMPIWTPLQNHNMIYVRAVSIAGYQSWGRIDNICIEEVPYACCGDEKAFVENADNAIQVYVDERTREVVFDAGNLPGCDSIAYIDWGDGNITPGPLPGNTKRRNKLLNHLLARVQYEVIEYNQDLNPAVPCFQHVFIDSVQIGSPDTCYIGGFAELIIRQSGNSTGQLIGCDEVPFLMSCPDPGTSVTVSGLFQCLGDECSTQWPVHWTLARPGGTYSGTVLANPYFNISLLPEVLAEAGAYTLTYEGQCGDQVFSCSSAFIVDCTELCPCTAQDIDQFSARVQRGFAMLYPEHSCMVCFSPIALDDCETIEWYLNSTDEPPIGTSVGRQTFCYEFPEDGVYDVIMNVSKKKDDGSNCDKQKRTQSVSPCHAPTVCVDPLIDNPDFDLGAVPGVLGSGGISDGWTSAGGQSEVIAGEPGSADGWTIQIEGNLNTGGILSRTAGTCVPKGPGVFATTVKSSKSNSSERRPASSLEFYVGSQEVFIRNECNSLDCYALASVTLPVFDTAVWIEIQIPYDLNQWEAIGNCGGSSDVLLYPYVYVSNAFGDEQGGESTFSYTQLDDICMRQTIVSVADPLQEQKIRIYPNPNNGEFTVEFAGPVNENMAMRIVSLTGQLLFENQAMAGSVLQTIQTEDLAEGIYFLQLISADHEMIVKKFVKQ